MKDFLKRTFDEKTMTWRFPDGSGVITAEGRQRILDESFNPRTGKHNLFAAILIKEDIASLIH